MTLTLGSRPPHLEDVDLVRYMDRQMDRAGNRRAELHLTTCAECAARLQALRDRAHTLTSWLAELDVPPVSDERRALAMAAVQRARFRARPMAWTSRPALAAAAMVALLLTAAFGTAPGRAWVSGAAERLGVAFPGQAPTEAPAAAPAQVDLPPAPVESVVTEEAEPGEPAATARPPARARRAVLPPGMSEPVPFNPTSNYVLLKFDSRQRVGVATVWIRDIPRASAQVVAGRQAETLMPTGDGLQVRNTRGSRADYQVEIPTRYRFVRVQIGDEPEQVIPITRSRRDGLWSISLTDDGS
jgi:anti-sigma factor RsiW